MISLCECGCNQEVNKGRRFKWGHATRLRFGSNHPRWKGGFKQSNFGYILTKRPTHHFAYSNGYVLEHRVVWEEAHNAILLPWADIHHKNHTKTDNRLDNLEVLGSREHSKLHRSMEDYDYSYLIKDMSDRFCIKCKSKNTYIDKDTGRPHWYGFKDNWICKLCYNKTRPFKLVSGMKIIK